jgi:hypothetical protein
VYACLECLVAERLPRALGRLCVHHRAELIVGVAHVLELPLRLSEEPRRVLETSFTRPGTSRGGDSEPDQAFGATLTAVKVAVVTTPESRERMECSSRPP